MYQVLGVKQIAGPKKDGSGPFEMNQLGVIVPIEPGDGKIKVVGYGYEVGMMEISPEVIPKMATMKFPAELELETEQRFMFGEFRTLVVGFRPAVKGPKAA